jgi:hypothetical protein
LTTTTQPATFPASGCAQGWVWGADTGCAPCPAGQYCANATTATPCPAGTFNAAVGAYALEQCVECPAGSFDDQTVGRDSVCPPCPSNFVCANSSVAVPCPEHTVSPEGSLSLQSCSCVAGYECHYKKVVTFHIVFNSTMAPVELIQNNSVLMEQFTSQVATACSVDAGRVSFVGYTIL